MSNLSGTYLLDNLIILPKCLVARGTKISGRVTISGTHQHSLHPKSQGVHKPSSIYESACSVVVRTAMRRQQRLNLLRRRSFRYRESATRSRGKNSALAVRRPSPVGCAAISLKYRRRRHNIMFTRSQRPDVVRRGPAGDREKDGRTQFFVTSESES